MSKRVVDLALAWPILALALPVFAAVAVWQRLTGDRGPLLYRALRLGEGGRIIEVLKLRTMRHPPAGPQLTRQNDARVTPIGGFLRRTKLDELPQLVNVIRGEMSLVGPRPEDPAFVNWDDPAHAEVFRARPGMTGLSQLRFRREEGLHTGQDAEDSYRRILLPQKVTLDRWYLRHRDMRLDTRILLRTLAVIVRAAARGAHDTVDDR